MKLNTKLRIPLLAILLMLLLTPAAYTQTPPESLRGQSNVYGIEPEQVYPGSLILELMEAAEEEIDAAVSEAFAEGYKAAMLQYAPDAAAYRHMAETMRAELEAERKKSRNMRPLLYILAGLSLIGGLGIGILIAK